MIRLTKKIIIGILTLYAIIPFAALAAADYAPLTTVPGVFTECVPGANGDASGCAKADPVSIVKNAYSVSIGIAAILAIGIIIWAGIEYVTTETISGHSDAKEKWQGALAGLLLLLASYLILRTINSSLVNVNLDLTPLPANQGNQIDVDALQNFVDTVNKNAAQAIEANKQQQEAVDTAQNQLAEAQKSGDPAQITLAQKQLTEARNGKIGTEISANQSQSMLDAAKAIKAGNYNNAVDIAKDAVNKEQQLVNQITDPALKAAAQSNFGLNLEKERAFIASTSVLNGLSDGTYPTVGGTGASRFQTDRNKFINDTNTVILNLTQTNPAVVAQYTEYRNSQLAIVDQQWQTNLKKCPNGYSIQTGCK